MTMSENTAITSFKALNDLELSLVAAQKGELHISEFMKILLKSKIYIPSTEEVQLDGQGLQPLFFEKQGIAMVAVFTELSRITDDLKRHAKYCLSIRTRAFIEGFPKGFGIVINPGHLVGLEISSEGIDGLKTSW